MVAPRLPLASMLPKRESSFCSRQHINAASYRLLSAAFFSSTHSFSSIDYTDLKKYHRHRQPRFTTPLPLPSQDHLRYLKYFVVTTSKHLPFSSPPQTILLTNVRNACRYHSSRRLRARSSGHLAQRSQAYS